MHIARNKGTGAGWACRLERPSQAWQVSSRHGLAPSQALVASSSAPFAPRNLLQPRHLGSASPVLAANLLSLHHAVEEPCGAVSGTQLVAEAELPAL